MTKHFLSFLLLLSFVIGVSGQTIDVADRNLRADVGYLAGDALEGRRTGEPGATAAAKYIEKTFKSLKLKPLGKDGRGKPSFFQTFPYVTAVTPGAGNSAAFIGGADGKKIDLKLGEDWMPLAFSASTSLERAALVDVGYGISAPTLGYDDYRGVDIKGNVAVALDSIPDRKFMAYSDLRRKATIARDAGAKGLIIITDVKKYAKLSYDNLGDVGIPVIAVSAEALKTKGVDWNYGLPVPLQVTGRQVNKDSEGNVTITEAGGFIIKYKVDQSGARIDGKTTITVPGGAALELSDDVIDHARIGSRKDNLAFSVSVDLVKKTADSYNVVGILPGTDPALKDEALIIGAHYDHLGRGGQGSLAINSTEVHHGADDNASGTAAMLQVAREYAKAKKNKRSIIFIAFSGEEEGLLGSKFYVNNPLYPLDKTVAMLNMDMVGRLADDKLNVGGVGTAAEWRELVTSKNSVTPPVYGPKSGPGEKAPESYPRFNLQLSEDGFGPSDHSSFYGKQIPVLFFFTGTHADYHKPSDTADKINYDGIQRIIVYVKEIASFVLDGAKRPTYKVAQTSGQGEGRRNFAVTIGVVPGNYGESNEGMLIDGVRDGGPAALAGMKGGDMIIKFAGKEIRNVQDYMYVLGDLKPDVEYEIVVKRGTETLTLKVKPQARK